MHQASTVTGLLHHISYICQVSLCVFTKYLTDAIESSNNKRTKEFRYRPNFHYLFYPINHTDLQFFPTFLELYG